MMQEKEFKSPIRKLVKFFEKSRDNWKSKYNIGKIENKCLKNQVYKLTLSKKNLKDEIKKLKQQLSEVSSGTKQMELLSKKN